jgi:acyl-CoA synthetase (AMP-forming)/AMP-acid ligase II
VFAALRILTCGGEAADPKRLAAVRKAAPGVRLVNVYGPTEATVVTTTYDFADAASSTGRVPIGRPVAETRIYVLDAYGHETGIGVPGEVYIGGARLARGYLRRPDLTAERFIPSTFAEGERLYRTGDVARWNEEGELEFLGRVDQQVKINGIRIEPEEIASVLATHRGVRAAFVSVAGHPDSRYLAAYVVAESPDPVEPRELRAYLSARLPDAMVPAWYVGIPELPLTPNGKVDRSALPAPSGRDGSQAGTIYVPPRSPAEKLVAQTWEKILGVSDLSVHDNFFELGGHSLTAMRAGSHLGRALDIKVPIGVLFESQTLKDMALAIEDQLLSELEGMSDEEAQTFLSAYPGEL